MERISRLAAGALALGLAVAAAGSVPGAFAQEGRSESRPLDLTTLEGDVPDEPEVPAEGEGADPSAHGAGPPDVAPAAVAPGGIRARRPDSIRLASVGIDIPALDGLDRLMWGATPADKALTLLGLLPERTASPAIQRGLEHLMLSRAVPPGGGEDNVEAIVETRLDWLKTHSGGEDLAALVRQLPDQPPWLEWKRWLVLHDLINRNDEEGCRYAAEQVVSTLDSIWHQINAFCHVVAGDVDQASFGLDILADMGIEDPAYFALMGNLTGISSDASIPEDVPVGPLNLVLMDSARVEITEAALQSVTGHRTSLWGLGYLGDDAQILLGARLFGRSGAGIGEVTSEWAGLPEAGVTASEALTRLSVAEGGDETDLSRLLVWQAVVREDDATLASDMALRALSADYRNGGARSLELWAPFIQGEDGAVLGALLRDPAGGAAHPEAAAWTHILADSPEPITAEQLAVAGAIDAIPVLRAADRSVDGLDWQDQVAYQRVLAPGKASLRYGHLLALEDGASPENKAETLLLAAVALGPAEPGHMGRDDAARLVAALMRAGLEATARELAREILVGWALERHFNDTEDADVATG